MDLQIVMRNSEEPNPAVIAVEGAHAGVAALLKRAKAQVAAFDRDDARASVRESGGGGHEPTPYDKQYDRTTHDKQYDRSRDGGGGGHESYVESDF